MKRLLAISAILIIFSATAQAETIKVAGSGGMISLVTELANAYMAKNQGDVIEVEQKSIEAKGGIMGAADGRLDIGMSARALKKEEIALGLDTALIAKTAGVFAVNADSVTVAALKSSQICDIFSGKIMNWREVGGHDASINIFTKPDHDSTKGVMRESIACFSVLTEAPHVVVLMKAQDMFNALINKENSIGITDVVAVDDSKGKLRALQLDGISPTEENIKNGKWIIIKQYTLVTKGAPTGIAKKFIEFIKSPAGSSIITKNKAVPIN